MIQGLLLLFLTGILWAGLAAVVAEAGRRQQNITSILLFSAIIVLFASGGLCFIQGPLKGSFTAISLQFILLIAAGSFNYVMLLCVRRAMSTGNGGIVWGFTQSSMIIPFMVGLIFFHEPAGSIRLSGVAAVMAALLLFSCSKSDGSQKGYYWLLPTIAAFILSGTAQSCASLPSYLQLEGMTSLRRMNLTQAGIILAALIDMGICRKAVHIRKSELIAAGAFGGFNLVALCCFYYGLNLLANNGYGSIGYPVGQGSSIAVFFIFCRLAYREKSSPISYLALAFLLTGLSLIAAGIWLS